MNKQYQGSKKKARKEAFEKRHNINKIENGKKQVNDALLDSGDIELIALLMGIPLK